MTNSVCYTIVMPNGNKYPVTGERVKVGKNNTTIFFLGEIRAVVPNDCLIIS